MSDQGVNLPVSIPVDDSGLDRAATKLSNLAAQAANMGSVNMGGGGGNDSVRSSYGSSIPQASARIKLAESGYSPSSYEGRSVVEESARIRDLGFYGPGAGQTHSVNMTPGSGPPGWDYMQNKAFGTPGAGFEISSGVRAGLSEYPAPYYQPGRGYGGGVPPGFDDGSGPPGPFGFGTPGEYPVDRGPYAGWNFRDVSGKMRLDNAGLRQQDNDLHKEEVSDVRDRARASRSMDTDLYKQDRRDILDDYAGQRRQDNDMHREAISEARERARAVRESAKVAGQSYGPGGGKHSYAEGPNGSDFPIAEPVTDSMDNFLNHFDAAIGQYNDTMTDQSKMMSRMKKYKQQNELRNDTLPDQVFPGLANQALIAKGFLKGGLYAVGNSASDWFATQTHATETGRIDMAAEARQPGMLMGGLIGAGIGSLMGGFGGIIGGSVGGQVGGMFGEYLAAQHIRDTRVYGQAMPLMFNRNYEHSGELTLSNTGAPYAEAGDWRLYGTKINNRMFQGTGVVDWSRRIQEDTRGLYSDKWKDRGVLEANTPTQEELLSSRNSLESAFLSAGVDPNSKYLRSKIQEEAVGIQKWVFGAGADVMTGRPGSAKWVPEMAPLGSGIVTDAALRYAGGQADVIKMVTPIAADITRSGGNAMDILSKFGPEATARWEELNTPIGQKVVSDEGTLREMTHAVQSGERNRAINQYGVRGVAASQYSSDQSVMSEIDRIAAGNKMPGLYQSETYQKMKAQMRGDLLESQDEAQITRFGIPMTRLAGEQARNQILPFSPGNSYKNDLQTLQVLDREIPYRQKEMADLRRTGQLSEREELRRTQELEGFQTQAAGRLADLSEGMIDRLPAFSAGRPSGFHSYDSMQLVQMQLQKVGHPSRYWGALNGQQADFQDSFARGFAVPGTDRPWSRMSGLDSAHLPVQRGPNGTVVPVSVAPGNDGGSPDVPVPMAPDTVHALPPGNRVSTVSVSKPITANGGTDTKTMEQLLAQIASTLNLIASRSGGQGSAVRPTEANGRSAAFQKVCLDKYTNGSTMG